MAHHGDPEAFELIYRMHCTLVYRICLRMLRDPFEAEDLAQEAFLLVFRKIHTFRGESAFSSWLYRLTTNLVLMRFRKKIPASASLEEFSTHSEDGGLPSEIGETDLQLSGLFDRMDLEAAIDLLPPGCKTAFILHDVEGYGHREIAGILGCSVGNSKFQLHKARMRLRKLLRRAKHSTAQQRRNVPSDSLALVDSPADLAEAHQMTS